MGIAVVHGAGGASDGHPVHSPQPDGLGTVLAFLYFFPD